MDRIDRMSLIRKTESSRLLPALDPVLLIASTR